MATRSIRWWLAPGLLATALARWAGAQAPTLGPETSIEPAAPLPGSGNSMMGAIPGSGGATSASAPPGAGQILGGRPGATTPRVPTSVSTPGEAGAQAPVTEGVALPRALPLTEVPLFGSLALPTAEGEGPPDGLTIDQALDRTARTNLDLLARHYEIPLAQADILTAGLRANPIFYADGQLVPYGAYTRDRPGGQTQYDVNISHPFDVSGKRRARVDVATRAKRVVEAQFQDAVRVQLGNAANAYVNALAARETLRFAETGLKGLQRNLEATVKLEASMRTRADVNRIRAQRDAAAVGVLDAREGYRKAKRVLATFVGLPLDVAERMELRGTIRDLAPPPPPAEELTRLALSCRPDVVAFRLGVRFAESGVRLQQANRLNDIYVLYQPYTFQNNAPINQKSATSWALGVTVPLPVYNRNQGYIERARLNVGQTRVQLAALERQVALEVRQAQQEYELTREYVRQLETGLLASAKQAEEDTWKLFQSGELPDVTSWLAVQREYNDAVRQYRDTAVRHRRSMLALNTAVGARILP